MTQDTREENETTTLLETHWTPSTSGGSYRNLTGLELSFDAIGGQSSDAEAALLATTREASDLDALGDALIRCVVPFDGPHEEIGPLRRSLVVTLGEGKAVDVVLLAQEVARLPANPVSGECAHEAYDVDTAGQATRCVDCGSSISPVPVAGVEGEPVAWRYRLDKRYPWAFTGDAIDADRLSRLGQLEPLYAAPPADTVRAALVEALGKIRDEYGLNHTSKWAAQTAANALQAQASSPVVTEGE